MVKGHMNTPNHIWSPIFNYNGPTQPSPEFNIQLLYNAPSYPMEKGPMNAPNHIRSLIFNSNRPTQPSLEFNIQLLYNTLSYGKSSP